MSSNGARAPTRLHATFAARCRYPSVLQRISNQDADSSSSAASGPDAARRNEAREATRLRTGSGRPSSGRRWAGRMPSRPPTGRRHRRRRNGSPGSAQEQAQDRGGARERDRAAAADILGRLGLGDDRPESGAADRPWQRPVRGQWQAGGRRASRLRWPDVAGRWRRRQQAAGQPRARRRELATGRADRAGTRGPGDRGRHPEGDRAGARRRRQRGHASRRRLCGSGSDPVGAPRGTGSSRGASPASLAASGHRGLPPLADGAGAGRRRGPAVDHPGAARGLANPSDPRPGWRAGGGLDTRGLLAPNASLRHGSGQLSACARRATTWISGSARQVARLRARLPGGDRTGVH